MDFASRYEISTTAEFVRSRGYKRVALQVRRTTLPYEAELSYVTRVSNLRS